jgi:hypothetical protein
MTDGEHGDLEAGLLEKARKGDAGAFVRFAKRWWEPVYRFTWDMSRNASFAAEVTERTIVAAIRDARIRPSPDPRLKFFLYQSALRFASEAIAQRGAE